MPESVVTDTGKNTATEVAHLSYKSSDFYHISLFLAHKLMEKLIDIMEEDDDVQNVCKNYPTCDAYVRVHPGTTIPMGSLANRKVRALRAEAHKHFNKIYLRGIMSREEAYEWLSAMLGIPIGNTHIGQMGEYYCQKVIDESKKLLAAHAKRSFRNGCEGRLARCS